LSTPGSDGEYLAELMVRAGLPQPLEYIGKPFMEIMKQSDRFQPVRFYRALQRNAAEAGVLAIHLQMDVVDAMVASKALSHRRLRWALAQSGAKVVTLTRQDKLFQAGLLGMFHGRPFRSIWTIPASRKKGFPGTIRSSFDDTHKCLMDLEQLEAGLKDLTHNLGNTVALTTEEMVTAPQAALARIGTLIGTDPTLDFEIPDYVDGYTSLEKLPDRIRDFRRQLIDRTGLQVGRP